MTDAMYPAATHELAHQRRDLAPAQQAAFEAFGKAVFSDGALPGKMKQIIAVAVAHVTQCPYCIKGHTTAALRAGATPEELMEAVWVASEMRAGAFQSDAGHGERSAGDEVCAWRVGPKHESSPPESMSPRTGIG